MSEYYGGNDGKSINRGNGKDKTKNVNIKLSADTKEAIRSIRELERQVNKLGDLADQGQRRQDGFLSSKQVQMYRRILKEIEQTYTQHQKNMQKIDQQYANLKSSAEAKKMKQFQDDLKKREQLLKNAEGGNKWGDVASPIIQEYHRSKLKEAQDNYNAYKSSDEYKNYRKNLQQIAAERQSMQDAISQISDERNRAQVHANRIDNMYERNPNARRYVNGMMHTLTNAGAVTNFHSYWGYTMNGIDILRAQERAANTVSLRMGLNTGDRRADATLRDINAPLGEKANYDAGQTAIVEQALISGGSDGNVNKLSSDTQAVQKFARSYALDPTQIAYSGSTLQKLGTFSEGEQQRFANMLAGAIAKEGMSGRQEEMLQATMSLVQNVSQNQAQFTQKQFSNVLGLQVAVGNAVPSLKGERGAQLLSNMDAAIKGGGQGLDLLMGKGTLFTGVQGMYQLKMMQEQGLSNPKNLQLVLQGAQRQFGTSPLAHQMTGFALKETLGLPLNEYEALSKSGLLDKIMKDPNSITSSDLNKVGAKELAKQWNQYKNSQTARIDSNQARGTNVQARNAKGANEIATASKGFFYGLGDYTDIGLIGLGGVGLGIFGNRIARGGANLLNRAMGGRIGGGGGLGGTLSNLRGGVATAGRTIASRAGGLLNGIKSFGADALEAVGGVSKAIPLVGGIVETGLDRVQNPKHSWGRSIAKGVGSALGTALGLVGSAAIDAGTGGLGIVTNAALVGGGGYAGSKVGDWVYSLFAGNDDTSTPTNASKAKQATKNVNDAAVPKASSSSKIKVDNLNVNNLNINDKKLADVLKGSGSNGKNDERVVRIIIEGNIQGMNDQNQDTVKNSIVGWLQSGSMSNLFKYNLSFDQTTK